ncbi:purine-cytosine permease family protein [Arthrobacter sp. 35W]|uniref:purine-cytosine permease family protein n=1 Tax=Arthrobacter sp. 35W TaxID=1132441 RepID=UPI0003F9707C|nr:cytosine permease [Arthrobacter sp. 35W]
MSRDTSAPAVESHHVDVIDPAHRHGKARDLFPVWFSANLNVGNAFFGALAVVLGNNLFWSIVAVVLANVAGGAFMALHSVQGSRLGVPQLIQSRGQFGFYGALLPVALAAFLFLGFFATTAVIGGQYVSAAIPGLDLGLSIALIALLSLVLALVGYRAIHTAAKWGAWPLAIAVVIVTIASLAHGGFDLTMSGFEPAPFFAAFGLLATFLLTYAPYVSDYSRYLPQDTPARDAFRWTFTGAFLGTTWTELVGVMLAVQFDANDISASISQLFGGGPVVAIVLLVTAVAIGGNNALNLYGGMLNLITAITTFRPVPASVVVRIVMLIPTFAIGLWIALTASADFSTNVGIFLSFLLIAFVPWGAINLIDYYWVRHGDYDVAGFFNKRGVYYSDATSWTIAGVNYKALTAYAAGVLVCLPFVSNAVFQGPGAAWFGGADLSWIPGLLATGAVYLVLAKRSQPAELVVEEAR